MSVDTFRTSFCLVFAGNAATYWIARGGCAFLGAPGSGVGRYVIRKRNAIKMRYCHNPLTARKLFLVRFEGHGLLQKNVVCVYILQFFTRALRRRFSPWASTLAR